MDPSEKIFGDLVESRRAASPAVPLDERTIEDLRQGTRSFVLDAGEAAAVSYVDREVPVRGAELRPVRVFNEHLGEGSPVLIFYPGCAFVFDLFEVNSIICSRIALNAGIKVILVQFRLAPENPMPTSIYDGYDATVYISTHSDDFGIDPAKIFLGGWCSGAHCAAAVSSLARGDERLHVYHQILLSGGYDSQ